MKVQKEKLPGVKECIAYIESCGWKLKNRGRSYYYFYNPDRPVEHKQMVFNLTELRHAFKHGW